MPNKSPKTWYVSYTVSSVAHGHRTLRATETFSGETEAKMFARAKTEAGDNTLVAGTLNPVSPKRMIPSTEIASWLYDES
jgi:hypothetical protein